MTLKLVDRAQDGTQGQTERATTQEPILSPLGRVDDQPVRVRTPPRGRSSRRDDQVPLWEVIRQSTDALSFNRYKAFVDHVLCRGDVHRDGTDAATSRPSSQRERRRRHERSIELPYPDIKAYKLLKCATEAFMLRNCSSVPFADIGFYRVLRGRRGARLPG